MSSSKSIILQEANNEQLVLAAANNHREYFFAEAWGEGGEVRIGEGVSWTYSGTEQDSVIAFPKLDPEKASTQIDSIIEYYKGLPATMVGCWSLDPAQPADLGVRLLARGFQPGWKPCWMALDLENYQYDRSSLAGLEIIADNDTNLKNMHAMPYAKWGLQPSAKYLDRPDHRMPQRYIARLNGEIVGQCSVFLTDGELGVGGIYAVGVIPSARNRGIGKAVVAATCQYAKEQGYRYCTLNATGKRMYQQLGFQWIGDGSTWWLKLPRLRKRPPGQKMVALAEAIGRGDLDSLETYHGAFSLESLIAPMTNDMSLMEFAAHCKQPESANWLRAEGVPISPLEAWEFGWTTQTEEILKTNPSSINQQYGEMQKTLLHHAAENGDLQLARIALAAKPDLSITDKFYRSTALGWAKHLHKWEISRLIETYQDGLK